MSKQRLGVGLGLALALFVSACGVALEPVQFTAAGPVVQPAVSGWQVLVGPRPHASAHARLHVQAFVAPEEQYIVDGAGVHFCHGEP